MKKITIFKNDNSFEFFFDENLNMWRLIENQNLIPGYFIDLEIDLKFFSNNLSWNEVEEFFDFLFFKMNSHNNIKDSQQLLFSQFCIINKSYDEALLKNIVFNISGINFKGYSKNVNLLDKFEYDLFFYPQNIENPYQDIGSYVWKANFRENLLLGVYCDRF